MFVMSKACADLGIVLASPLTGPCVEGEMIGSCLGTNPKCAWAIVDAC